MSYNKDGGMQESLYIDQRTSASWNKRGDPNSYTVEADADAIKPFNLVYVNKLHATNKTTYIKNAGAIYGKGNGEGELQIVEVKAIRTGASTLYDRDSIFKANTNAECYKLFTDHRYTVRATASAITRGDILICAADGTTKLLNDTTVGSTSFRGHAFISLESKTTTQNDPFLSVRYIGLVPLYAGDGQATTGTLTALIPTKSFMSKTGAGSVGTLSVTQYPPNAPALTGVIFASSDTSVATVNSSTGAITAVANGTTYITATKDSLVATCIVVVSGISP